MAVAATRPAMRTTRGVTDSSRARGGSWPPLMKRMLSRAAIRGRTSVEVRRRKFRGRGRLFVLVVVLAAELLELGEDGADVELAGLFLGLGGGHFGFLPGG